MNRLFVSAAFLAAGVFYADISFFSYISSPLISAASAQEAQSEPSVGFGNGGAVLGSGQAIGGAPAAGEGSPAAASGGSPAEESGSQDPDAATQIDGQDSSAKGMAEELASPEGQAAMAAVSSSEPAANAEAIGALKADLPSAGGTGNLNYSIDIDTVDFRGIEPSLTLTYNSSRKTKIGGLYQGWLGYAWGLDGIEVIERGSPGYGMPAFDANDVYLLDGQPLVACGTGVSSPSCSTGGTHATENEAYRRIALNSSANEWTVTDGDGAVSTFQSVAVVAGLTPAAGTPAYDLAYSYRWLLTSVTDTNGNSVAYTYTCPASPVCYPDTISYNGTVIKFHLEARPDLILMGNGRDISETGKRIKTISIKIGSALRSAYKLDYDQAPFSNASRLTAVTRYGSDASVATDGTITGGTAKPLGLMTYQNSDASYTTLASPLYGVSVPQANKSFPRQVGDLDFDGKDEVFGGYTETTTSMKDHETITTVHFYSRIYKYSTLGPLAEIKSTGGVFSQPGRFVSSKNTIDFAQYSVRAQEYGHNGHRIMAI